MEKINQDQIGDASFFDTPNMAKAFKCSQKHITNLRDRGETPPPVRMGSRVLWPKQQIRGWVEAGCPAIAL
jgi:predicted DNA-binding transcriptional regulator AlpA